MNNITRPLSCAALPALLVLVVGTSTAAAERYELSIGTTSRWMRSSSVDAIAGDDSHLALSLSGGIKLDQIPIPWFDLYIEGSFERGSLNGTSFERIESDTGITSGKLGVRAHREISSRLRLSGFGRAAAGLARISLALSDSYSRTDPMKDKGWAGVGYVGVGIDFMAISPRKHNSKKELFSIGLRAEAGYTAIGNVDVRAIPESAGDDGDAIKIPATAAPLGSLDVSAWSLSVGLVGRF